MQAKLAPFFILMAAVLWGTTGTAQALAPDGVHPIAIGAVRMAIAGLFLMGLLRATRSFNPKGWPIPALLMAALSMAAYQPLFFSAVTMTGVAIGTVVAIGSAPVLSGLLEWLFLKVRPARVWWISTVLSIAGCIMLFSNQGAVQADPAGILLALGAGLSFAVYTIVNRKLVQHHPPLSAVAAVFTLSAVMLSPFLFIFDISWVLNVRGLSVALHLGVITTAVAYILFSRGLSHTSSSTAVTLSLGEPLTAAMLGVLVLNEALSLLSWLGVGLLLLGIGVLIFSTARKGTRQRLDQKTA
ncbi:EamA family transporter [Jeotgalibacillus aurantiacus]|uniref:EamA family transporter n=1 Tax=Jeotgalibacillus aurantiacus TaxID=2763266 RepID=UPI001D0B365E|nr:EamA family transporter [Jeotgalibacillus aurantiacus]